MWKLVTYVTCVVILFPNAYGYMDYTSYLLSRLTEYINQVNQLLRMIYKQRTYRTQTEGDPFELDGLEHDYLYDHALWQTITTLKNAHRVMAKLKNEQTVNNQPDMIALRDHIALPDFNVGRVDGIDQVDRVDGINRVNRVNRINRVMGVKQSGRRNAQQPDWSNNFYEALATAFKKFLLSNPDVRTQLGDDFNADALINPPEPEKKVE